MSPIVGIFQDRVPAILSVFCPFPLAAGWPRFWPEAQLWQGHCGQSGPGRGPGQLGLCSGKRADVGLCPTLVVGLGFRSDEGKQQ